MLLFQGSLKDIKSESSIVLLDVRGTSLLEQLTLGSKGKRVEFSHFWMFRLLLGQVLFAPTVQILSARSSCDCWGLCWMAISSGLTTPTGGQTSDSKDITGAKDAKVCTFQVVQHISLLLACLSRKDANRYVAAEPSISLFPNLAIAHMQNPHKSTAHHGNEPDQMERNQY